MPPENLIEKGSSGLFHALYAFLFDANKDQKDFLPAALEIMETPPSPLARGVNLTLICFFIVALIWSFFGIVDIVAVAPGRIVPTGRTKLVQPLEAGVVRAIHVQDGQQVRAGDVLLEIDSTINEAEQGRIEKEYYQEALDVARLNAARLAADGPMMAFIPPEGADYADVVVARNLLDSQVREIRAKVANIDSQIEQNEAGRKAVDATIDKLSNAEAILRQRHTLQQAEIDRLSSVQEISDQHKEIGVQEMRLEEADSMVAALEEQRQQVIAEYKRNIASDLSEAQRKAASLSAQLVQARQRTKLQTLTAPVDGTVQQLSVHTEGGVVSSAQVLLAVVPLDSKLEIEASVSNRDIGFVHAGQDAEIKIDTFNFTKYGLVKGKVISVSQDAVMRDANTVKSAETEDQRKQMPASSPAAPQEMVYVARINPEQSQMDIDGKMVNLAPGMAATVEIKTGQRRIIEYILSPLLRAKQQALKER